VLFDNHQTSLIVARRFEKPAKSRPILEKLSAPRGAQGMAISMVQSTQIELADCLGVVGTTRRRGTFFFTNLEQPRA
jgi:hypothetical protein